MKAVYLDNGQPTLLQVCATDAIDAHSEVWKKLPENRLDLVDTFQIISVHACEHERGRIV